MTTIMKCIFGSHLYGTSSPSSDMDYKGIFLPPIEDCILGKVPKSFSKSSGNDKTKNTNEDIDEEIYSLQYFIQLACEGQTVALDMLHCNDGCLIETSEIWSEIVKNRKRFYTNNLSAFIGYARKQASKYSVIGSRLHTCEKVIEFLKSKTDKKLSEIWDELPSIEHTDFLDDPKNPTIQHYQVCGKKFQSTVRVDYVLPILEKFWSEYGERARMARENKFIDWKALSHAIRAAFQVKEILTENDLTFPLKEAKLLKDIKEGKMDYVTEVNPLLEGLMMECEDLSKVSKLPSKVDRKFWDNFIVECYGEN